MPSFARIYYLVYGVITVLSGVSGYVLKGSKISMIAGGATGLLLVIGSLLLRRVGRPFTAGLAISMLVSLLLTARFLGSLFNGLLNPALYMVPLSVGGVCVAAVLLFRTDL